MRYKTEAGHFELNPFPGNNQIVVSTHAFIKKELRGNGYGKAAARERLRLAEELGYSYMLCTVRKDNEPQLKIMRALGWKELDSFYNHVTEAEVIIFGRGLGSENQSEVEHLTIWRCSECKFVEGEAPQAGCCSGCGMATDPEQLSVQVLSVRNPAP